MANDPVPSAPAGARAGARADARVDARAEVRAEAQADARAAAPASDALLAYVERFAGVLTDSGIPRMPSRVFAALLVTDSGRLTATELADMLAISPAAVSGAVRYLMQIHLITRERDPGSRRDRYRVLDEVWQEAILNRESILARWEASLAEGVALVGAETPAGARLTESVRMFQFLRREVRGVTARWFAERDAAREGGSGDVGGEDGSAAGAAAVSGSERA